MVTKREGSENANTVKIDENLLKQVKALIKDPEIRIEYPTAKQFINMAVFKFLKEKSGQKKRSHE
jgi:hypothetical protein